MPGGSAGSARGSNGRAAPGRPKPRAAPSGGSAVREATSVGALKAGMFARGDFQLGRSNALTVPQASIVPRDGFNYVLLLQPDNRVGQLKIETGRRVGDRVEVLTKMPADARVVVQGAGFLNDGDLVRVVASSEEKAAAAPASTAQTAIK